MYTLRLIESNTSPDMGDLVISKRGWIGVFGQHENSYPDECKVVKPYGLSDEEIQVGDTIMNTHLNTIHFNISPTTATLELERKTMRCKKVVLLPEQFNYQDIVNLNLKDGDSFEYHSRILFEKGIITKPSPIMYTEEEVRELCRFTYSLGRDDKSKSQAMGEYYDTFDTWFEQNKKSL